MLKMAFRPVYVNPARFPIAMSLLAEIAWGADDLAFYDTLADVLASGGPLAFLSIRGL